jgi:hypothetical protein
MNAPMTKAEAIATTPVGAYPAAFVSNKTSPVKLSKALSWGGITSELAKIKVGAKDGSGWIPADIEVGPRTSDRVKSVSLLVLDIEADAEPVKDESGNPVLDANGDIIKKVIGPEPPDFGAMLAEVELWGWRCILHTSYSHTDEHPRFRLVLDVGRLLQPAEIKPLGLHVAGLLGIDDCIDTKCLEPARLFYLPRAPEERVALFRHTTLDGVAIDVDTLLGDARSIEAAQKLALKKRRSGKSESVIDAFNDAHDVGLILQQSGYEPKGRKRWLYPESTTGMPGVRLLPDQGGKQMIYSSHGGDPLNDGHAHDAFDLWRILNHGGDMRAAVRDAASVLGMDRHDAVDLSALIARIGGTTQPDGEMSPEADPDPPETTDHRAYPPPFRGVMHDAVQAALAVSTKPQPDLCTLSTLIGMAGSCAGFYGLPSGMRLNLYGCGVAETGEGKDQPRTNATVIVKAAGGKLIGKPASGPGLEDSLPSHSGALICLDEIAHFFAAMNNGKAPPHLIELASILLQLFSASRGEYHTRVKAVATGTTAARTIFHPAVSLLGFATPGKLGEAMGVSNIEDGLLGRFLFAFGESGIVPRRISSWFVLPDSVALAAAAVREATPPILLPALLGNAEIDSIPILIDPAAEKRLAELLVEFDQQRQSAKSAFAKALLTRSCEKCERVAGVLAVWDSPLTPTITPEHVEWAAQLMLASDAALLRFSGEYMHGGQTQANAQKVLALINRAVDGELKPQKKHEMGKLPQGAAPYSMVMRASKLAKRDFDDAVAHLVDLSEVELVTIPSRHPNGREEKMRCLKLRN